MVGAGLHHRGQASPADARRDPGRRRAGDLDHRRPDQRQPVRRRHAGLVKIWSVRGALLVDDRAYAIARSSGTSRTKRSDRPRSRLKDKAGAALCCAGAMNQTVRPLPQPIRIGASACPHDCPSTCALEVEVLDERTIGRVRGAPGQRLHRRRDLRQGRALRRAHASSRPADAAAAPDRRQGLRLVRADLLGRRARSRRREIPRRPSGATARRRSGPTTTPAPWAW